MPVRREERQKGGRSRAFRGCLLASAAAVAALTGFSLGAGGKRAGQLAQAASEGQLLFSQKCSSCHTVGRGDLVGPDLKGVTSRRDRDWLRRWITAPDQMLAAKDPTATQLLEKYKVPMPNLGLTGDQVTAIISYLETAGQQAPAGQGLPRLYLPTLAASALGVVVLTALALIAGRKKVEVRP